MKRNNTRRLPVHSSKLSDGRHFTQMPDRADAAHSAELDKEHVKGRAEEITAELTLLLSAYPTLADELNPPSTASSRPIILLCLTFVSVVGIIVSLVFK